MHTALTYDQVSVLKSALRDEVRETILDMKSTQPGSGVYVALAALDPENITEVEREPLIEYGLSSIASIHPLVLDAIRNVLAEWQQELPVDEVEDSE